MNWTKIKLGAGLVAMVSILTAARLLAQRAGEMTNPPAGVFIQSPALPDASAGLAQAMFDQVLNNPSSLLLIAFLCVFAWLADDLPFLNSRYVAHCTVILGALTYWTVTSVASVPKTFPHPQAVFVMNGTLCGFVAFVIHKQAVARVIAFVRAHGAANVN